MKKTLLYQICLLLLVINIKAQTFQKTFGTPGDDYSSDVIQTSDKGYAVLGTLNGSGIYLLKTDSLGNKQWSKNLSLESVGNLGVLRAFSQTSDGGFILGGTIKYSSSGNYYSFVVKTDNTGNVIWSKMNVALSVITCIKQTFEGDYIAVGGSYSTIIKFNASGDIIRSRTFPMANYTMDVVQIKSDSSFVTYFYSGSASQNLTISRFSKNINLIWSKTITSPTVYAGTGLGHIYENGNDLQIALNTSGSLGILSINKNGTNAKFIGTSNIYQLYNYFVADAILAANKGVVLISQYNIGHVGDNNTETLLISLDSLGGFNWAKQIGGANTDEPRSIKQTKDKGFIIAGQTKSFSAGYSDIYLIKTDSLGESGCHTSPITFTTSTTPITANLINYTGTIDSLFNNITSSQTITISNPIEVTYNACICVPPVASFTPNTSGDMQENSIWADKWYWTCSGIPGVIDSTTINKSYYGSLPDGTYTVCLKVKNSCGVDSLCQPFTYVYYPVNVKENTENLISNLYPNPFHDKLIITRENPNLNMLDLKIRVTNSFGSLVYSDTMEGTEKEIQLPELASGLYFIQFISNGIVVSRKLVKE